jgi:hypothetical protein
MRINPKWQEQILSEIGRGKTEFITNHPLNSNWLVSVLVAKNLQPKVVNIGAGVKRIIIMGEACPYCKGTGRKT